MLKGGSHGEGLQLKGKQGVLQVQCERPSCKGLQEQEGAVQWHQQGSREARLFQLLKLEGASEEGGLELLVELGCNGFMLKDRVLFKELDEALNTDVGNANGSRTRVEGRGAARCGVVDSKGKMCELEQAFWVSTYTRNLISVRS